VVRAPAHPYTQGLIASIPTLDMAPGTRIEPIRGVVPRIGSVTSGCRFRSRCPHAMPVCETDPPMLPAGEGQDAACWLLEGRA
jgi:oligopeptide/dipeptide ABC transporter ATP-binding protein